MSRITFATAGLRIRSWMGLNFLSIRRASRWLLRTSRKRIVPTAQKLA